MPKPADYDLSRISARVIAYSDRIQCDTKKDWTTPACTVVLTKAGLGPVTVAAIPKNAGILETEIRDALEAGIHFILILSGSSFNVGSHTPKVAHSVIEVRIPDITEQTCAHSLANAPLSGPPRGVIGVTAHDSSDALIISSPGSWDGALNTLEVVTPLLPAVFYQLGEQH